MATHSSILTWYYPMDRGAWRATVHGVTQESDTTYPLNNSMLLVLCSLAENVILKTSYTLSLKGLSGDFVIPDEEGITLVLLLDCSLEFSFIVYY